LPLDKPGVNRENVSTSGLHRFQWRYCLKEQSFNYKVTEFWKIAPVAATVYIFFCHERPKNNFILDYVN